MYRKSVLKFLTAVRSWDEVENATFEIPRETPNTIIVSGEVAGAGTYSRIAAAGMEHGLLVISKKLKVIE